MFDGALRLRLPVGTLVVGFADDMVLAVCGQSLKEVVVGVERTIEVVEAWMAGVGLGVAHHKTEMILVSNLQAVQVASVKIGRHVVQSQDAIRYLGVMVDRGLSFGSHVDYAMTKALGALHALSGIMCRTTGLGSSKKKLLATVVSSVLRYACPAWAEALAVQKNVDLLNRVHRLTAIQVAGAFRTVSLAAVSVIAGMVPVRILVEEDRECYAGRGTAGIRAEAKRRSLERWQREWENDVNGRWTFRLIPIIERWLSRDHGEVNPWLTQFLSGHGNFREYLHRFKRAPSPECPACAGLVESPEHVLLVCPRFDEARDEMMAAVGERVTVEKLVDLMCQRKEAFDAINRCVGQIMSRLQLEWREFQRLQAAGAVQLQMQG
uniref:Putative r1-7 dk n=1 Tax=Anopheles triannulatus TaxID=58253 RepID=A0A2M4AST8_9DIPT